MPAGAGSPSGPTRARMSSRRSSKPARTAGCSAISDSIWAPATAAVSHGRAEEVALRHRAAELAQDVGLRLALDPLGDDAEPERGGHRDDGGDDRRVLRAAPEVGHERAVDLDRVDGEVLQVLEGRVARPE